MDRAIADGRFSLRPSYHLTTFTLSVPLLRERRDDIQLLIKHLLVRATAETGKGIPTIDSDAMEFFLSSRWAGNIRELQSAVLSGVILSRSGQIAVGDLPATMSERITRPAT